MTFKALITSVVLLVASHAMAEWSLVLSTSLPSGATEISRLSDASLYRAASDLIDDVARELGSNCLQTEAFIWSGTNLFSRVSYVESMVSGFNTTYRELVNNLDAIIFRVYESFGPDQLGYWIRLDGATLLVVCSI